MKRLLNRIKFAWLSYWEDDEYDRDKKHLSKADKRWLLWGATMICLLTMLGTSLLWTFVFQSKTNDQYEKELTDVLNIVATYISTATDDEYKEIAEQIRDEFVFTQFNPDNDIEMYMKYIPNTSEHCPLDRESYPAQYYVVLTNTGSTVQLDVFDKTEDPDAEYGTMQMNSGWDEISETSVAVACFPDDKSADVSITSDRGVVSAHRMKSIFCDDCIREIFAVFEETYMEEVFIFDSTNHVLYPLKESKRKT